MRSKSTNKLSFILYEQNRPPKYFEIKKTLLRFLLLGLPSITLLSITITTLGIIYFQQLKILMEQKTPKMISELRKKNANLIKGQEELVIFNNKLKKKLITTEKQSIDPLSLFYHTKGQEDLSLNSKLKIEQLKIDIQNEKIGIDFNLVNGGSTTNKISGHLFVLMQNQDSIHLYPKEGLQDKNFQIVFNTGESFAFFRLRPFAVTFPKNAINIKELVFKILVFSRIGDLIHKELFTHKISE